MGRIGKGIGLSLSLERVTRAGSVLDTEVRTQERSLFEI